MIPQGAQVIPDIFGERSGVSKSTDISHRKYSTTNGGAVTVVNERIGVTSCSSLAKVRKYLFAASDGVSSEIKPPPGVPKY